MARSRFRPNAFVAALITILMMVAARPGVAVAQASAEKPSDPQIGAAEAIVVDYPSGRILFQKAAHDRMPPASLTKILTAILALEYGNLDDVVSIDPADLAGESTMGLVGGEQQKLHDLLYGMMLPSGNDAAMAIARHLGSHLGSSKTQEGDPIARFADMMNARVAQLGLTDSHFVNPHGLDAQDHFSSAYDLASLAWYALHLPAFNEIVSTIHYEAPGHSLLNTNEMLTRYAGADGIKTGWTDGCGLCLVTSATRNNHRLISVVLNAPQWYSDSTAILDYGFEQLDVAPSDAQAEVLSVSKRDTVTWLLANPASAPPLPAIPPMAQGGGAASEPKPEVSGPAVVPAARAVALAPADNSKSVVASGKSVPNDLIAILVFAVSAVILCLLLSRLWGFRPAKILTRGIGILHVNRLQRHREVAVDDSGAITRPRPVQVRTWGGERPAQPAPKTSPIALGRRREPNLLTEPEYERVMHIERAVALSGDGKHGSGMSEFVMAFKTGAQIDVAELAERYQLSAGAFLALARAQVAVGQPENARRTLLHGVLVMPNERVLRLALYQLQPDH